MADILHPQYPEDAAVFAERLQLCPASCLVLESGQSIQGYAIGHPWFFRQPPELNTRLRELPSGAKTFHIHDVALIPDMRGTGLGMEIVDRFAQQATIAGLESISLIAVGGSLTFWHECGFQIIDPVVGLSRG